MWKLVFVLVLPILPLAAAHGGAPERATHAGAAAEVQCLIRASPMDGGVELEGLLVSEAPLSGTYEFGVSKAGSGGTSTSVQSGEFELQSGEQQVIGHVGLGLERGASYDAKLVVSWEGGETSCQATGPDRA